MCTFIDTFNPILSHINENDEMLVKRQKFKFRNSLNKFNRKLHRSNRDFLD